MDDTEGFVYWTLCDVLAGMRKCVKTLNFAMLPALIEDAQTLGNRMEAALGYKEDIHSLHKERKKLRMEVKVLKKKRKKLLAATGETTSE